MKRSILIGYQALTGLSDTSTGILLVIAPGFTLGLMKLHVPSDALPYLSYMGAFVLSVGIACFYGGWLATKLDGTGLLVNARLEVVWLLTGITRAVIAAFVLAKVFSRSLEPGWISVALTDGSFAVFQLLGLAKGWLRNVRP